MYNSVTGTLSLRQEQENVGYFRKMCLQDEIDGRQAAEEQHLLEIAQASGKKSRLSRVGKSTAV